MRVVAVTPLYPPASRVGAWLATHQFLAGLAERGHQVTAFAEMSRTKEYDLDGVHVETGLRGRSRAIRLACEADVVISHTGGGGLASEAAARAHVPHVRMVHGVSTDTTGDLLVFNSESLRAATPHDAPSIVAHPPVCPAEHEATPGDAVTLVNLSAAKGVKTAWLAAERLPDVAFLGVLGGYDHQIRPRSTNFEVLPTQRDMRAVWRRTRILLMPSALETYGLVALEAACSGIPTIAHPTPGLVESLGEAGIFADRDNVDEWVAEIERLQDPEEYEMASKRALARADELDPRASIALFVAAVEKIVCV